MKLILPCICADAVVVFDTASSTSQIIKTSSTKKNIKYIGIIQNEDFFYLITADGAVLKRELKSEDEEVKRIAMPKSEAKYLSYYPVQCADGYLYLFPFEENRGIKIDVKTDQAAWEPLLDEEEQSMFSLVPSCWINRKLYTVTKNGCCLMEYDFRNYKKRKISLPVSAPDQMLLKKRKQEEYRRLSETECMTESEAYSLLYMLDRKLSDRNDKNLNIPDGKYGAGSRIYHRLLDE